jgi:hypothetical protein
VDYLLFHNTASQVDAFGMHFKNETSGCTVFVEVWVLMLTISSSGIV